eukprot:1486736-Amphidinium_carterae.1
MDKEAARLSLDPKGQIQSDQPQTTAQSGQDDKDGFQPVRSRKGKPKTTKPAEGQKRQIASAGVALPVREKLLLQAPG